MLAGAIMVNVAVLQGQSTVMFTSYVPMKAAPHFYLGLLLFAVGALLGCFVFFGTLVVAREERTYQGSIPLVTFGALTAAIIAVFTIASGAIILIPTFLWSMGIIQHIDTMVYQDGLVGDGAFVTADQRRGPRGGLVCDRGDGARRETDLGKGEPPRVPLLHPVPADGERPSHAGGAGSQLGVEDLQHQATRCTSPCSGA